MIDNRLDLNHTR